MPNNRLMSAALLAAAIALPTAACAQQQPANTAPASGWQGGHHGHHRGGVRSALRGITLSDAQKQQIDTIVQQNRATMKSNPTTDPATRRANMQQLRTQIENVLTPAQRTQFEQNLQKQRAARPAPPAQQ